MTYKAIIIGRLYSEAIHEVILVPENVVNSVVEKFKQKYTVWDNYCFTVCDVVQCKSEKDVANKSAVWKELFEEKADT